MSQATSPNPDRNGGAIALEDLIALNDEIAALVRAGLPLERGLLGVGSDVPGRLGRIATGLGERLRRGDSLPEALAAEGPKLPATYRAVVVAGLRAGRLPAALEGLATFARQFAELRRVVGLALLYPMMVLMVGYALFLGLILGVIPRLESAFGAFRIPIAEPLSGLGRLGESAAYWGPIVPALMLLVAAWWLATGRASALRPGGLLRFVPWLRAILADWRASSFAGWLALLVEHGVPLPEAIDLAAEATGDPTLWASASRLAEATRRGEPLNGAVADRDGGLPPLLRWLMVAGQQQGALVPALKHAAETYRRRATHRAETLRTVLPRTLILVVGAGSALAYGLALYVPWTSLMTSLAGATHS